jgi:hypothetical protein
VTGASRPNRHGGHSPILLSTKTAQSMGHYRDIVTSACFQVISLGKNGTFEKSLNTKGCRAASLPASALKKKVPFATMVGHCCDMRADRFWARQMLRHPHDLFDSIFLKRICSETLPVPAMRNSCNSRKTSACICLAAVTMGPEIQTWGSCNKSASRVHRPAAFGRDPEEHFPSPF